MRYVVTSAFTSLALAGCTAEPDLAEEVDAIEDVVEAPAAEAAMAVAPARDEDVRQLLLQEFPEAGEGTARTRFAAAWHDLDGDGSDEAIVHIVSPQVCGTGGCNTRVLAADGATWREVGNISISRLPLGLGDGREGGWQDLVVSVGGGGYPGGFSNVPWTGERYAGNPTVEPALPVDEIGTVLLTDEMLQPLETGEAD